MSKISVIIPVYNGEAFIARAIKSALKQTVKPYEVIVIDDGSTDGTAEELGAFKDRVTVISIPNGGVANARNTGILASSGEFVAFLDADDVWYENKLRLQLDAFERFPEVGFCCCDYVYLNKNRNSKFNHFSRFKEDEDIVFDEPLRTPALEALIKQNFVGTCSNVMVRRRVLDQVGLFNINYKQAEDYDLWLRCALVTKFLLQSSALLEKSTHDNNLTNNFLETLLYHEKVLINIRHDATAAEQISQIDAKYQSALAKVRYEIGNLCYEANDRLTAFRYFFVGLGSCLSVDNFRLFGYFFGRKLLRTISFGLLKRKRA
ncbi:MAG: glycosyltransferase [Pseudomonadota bacterium]